MFFFVFFNCFLAPIYKRTRHLCYACRRATSFAFTCPQARARTHTLLHKNADTFLYKTAMVSRTGATRVDTSAHHSHTKPRTFFAFTPHLRAARAMQRLFLRARLVAHLALRALHATITVRTRANGAAVVVHTMVHPIWPQQVLLLSTATGEAMTGTTVRVVIAGTTVALQGCGHTTVPQQPSVAAAAATHASIAITARATRMVVGCVRPRVSPLSPPLHCPRCNRAWLKQEPTLELRSSPS